MSFTDFFACQFRGQTLVVGLFGAAVAQVIILMDIVQPDPYIFAPDKLEY